ncbi:Nucleoside-triphosphatase THEP1 [subsurface metagenome]
MKNILLTGRPGIGKTSIIKEVIDILKINAGGFYTREIREEEIRKGFEIITLNGKRGILAHVDCRSPYRVSKYGVNIKDLEEVAAPAIEEALRNKECIIIDEIGRMELHSPKFCSLVKKALDSEKRVLGTIQARHNEFLDSIRKREDTKIIEVTFENRRKIVNEIKEILRWREP